MVESNMATLSHPLLVPSTCPQALLQSSPGDPATPISRPLLSSCLTDDVDVRGSSQGEALDLDTALALSLRFSLSLGSFGSEEEVNETVEKRESEADGLPMDVSNRSTTIDERPEGRGGTIDAWEFDMQWDEYADHKFGGGGDPGFFAKATKRKSGGTGVGEEEEDEELQGKRAKKNKRDEKENSARGGKAEKQGGERTEAMGRASAEGRVKPREGQKEVSQALKTRKHVTAVTRKGVTTNDRRVLAVHNSFPAATSPGANGAPTTKGTPEPSVHSVAKVFPKGIAAQKESHARKVAGTPKPSNEVKSKLKQLNIPRNTGQSKDRQTRVKESRSKSLDLLSKHGKLNACRYRDAPRADSREERKSNRAWKGNVGLGVVAPGDEEE
ncbi:hypothetical protein BKA70DRAFT_1266228 [Coprinopsis sp. MPI-PUGE-AT-0042]|nr:hypothetical protein BKA70DRAFT_1266228 [Coprinopsis sp. MPI-PUGE-AT-0042]